MSKQPLEGLTVRIFDPPKVDASGNPVDTKGSRGYRQYTEQIGSDKLNYSSHQWDNDTTDSNVADDSKKNETDNKEKQ